MKKIEAVGRTIDDAIANGLAKLGVDRDSVTVEVLENPKNGFLGIGATPAKVSLTVIGEDIVEELEEEIKEIETEEAQEVVETVITEEVPAAVEEVAAVVEEVPAEAVVEVEEVITETEEVPARERKNSSDEEMANHAVQFVVGLLEKMNIGATVTAEVDGENLRIKLAGDDMGSLIGRRGETLDAIQHLTSYVVNRAEAKHLRVLVDTEGYRARREESLKGLARKTASRAVRYRRNIALEPMNAYERHVIHEALQDWRDVTTESTGTEPNRRVVVKYAPRHASNR